MTLFYAYVDTTARRRLDWKHTTLPIATHLANDFDHVLQSSSIPCSSEHLHLSRNNMWDLLFSLDHNDFPRFGQIGTPIEHIYQVLALAQPQLKTRFDCPNVLPCTTTLICPCIQHLPSILSTNLWDLLKTSHEQITDRVSIQIWVDLMLYSHQLNGFNRQLDCIDPCSGVRLGVPFISTPSPIIVFEIAPQTTPLPVPTNMIHLPLDDAGAYDYHLRGIVYYGGYHFTARLIDSNQSVWSYDGQLHGGLPQLDECLPSVHSMDDLSPLTTLGLRHQHLLIYSRVQ